MAQISEAKIRRAAAADLVRDLRAGVALDETEWIVRWLDNTGAEPENMQRFIRSVKARARRAGR